MHWASLRELNWIHTGSIVPQCRESSAFNDAAWNPLHSIGMLWAMLHKIHCIQSCCIKSTAFNRVPFLLHAAWNPLHSITLHGIHCILSGCFWPCCIKSTAFNHAACNPPDSIGMFWDMLQKIPCIKSGWFGPCCKKSTAFNHAAGIHCIHSEYFGPCC